jgi:mannose-6-phosphate isomerase-like protein (cupin superfamily)
MQISIQNAEHYKWGMNCDGWHLLKTQTLSVIQESMPPGSNEKLHLHERSQQLFYILNGTATFQVENETYIVGTGESIHIPAGKKHFISNNEKQALDLLVISEPKAHGDRINFE